MQNIEKDRVLVQECFNKLKDEFDAVIDDTEKSLPSMISIWHESDERWVRIELQIKPVKNREQRESELTRINYKH